MWLRIFLGIAGGFAIAFLVTVLFCGFLTQGGSYCGHNAVYAIVFLWPLGTVLIWGIVFGLPEWRRILGDPRGNEK